MSALKRKLHKNSKGFTLAEVMITVAIIIILLGLSVPNIIKQQQSLKKMELNRTAEEIYLAVQNSFSNLRLNGSLEKAMQSASGDYNGNYPGDYLGKTDSDKKFHSMASESDNMYKDYVETFSLKALGMPFAAEYTESGDVYSVFYTEDAGIKAVLSSAAASGDVGTLNSYRDDKKVGYYTTKSLENSFFEDADKLNVSVPAVTDGDKLYVDINIANGLSYAGVSSNIKYKVEYKSSGTTVEKEYNGLGAKLDGDGNLVLRIMLDSLEDNVHFKDVVPGLPSGRKVTMTVKDVTLSGVGDKTITMETGTAVTAEFNPLFVIANDGSSKIGVSYARHLNNLRSEYFTPDANTNYTIEQANDIDVSSISQYGPIRNDALFSGKTVYNGNRYQITGLNLSIDDGGYAGLFAKLACTVKNLAIINPHVSVSAGHVGALCGEITDGKIDSCHVFCDKEQADSCYVNGYGECTGGLIGYAKNTTITESFAAVDVNGCGGFAGKLDACTVEHCYSSGKVTAVGYPAGGFAAYASGNICNCYTTSDVVSSAECGGFAYEVSGVTSCNAYGRVWDGANIYIDDDAHAPFAVIGSASKCYFLVMPNYNDVIGDGEPAIGEKYYLSYITEPTSRKAYNYSVSLDEHANVFPFDFLGIEADHYGNWPHGYIDPVKTGELADDDTHSYRCIVEACGRIEEQPHNYLDELCLTCNHIKTDTENGGLNDEETP